MGAALLIARTRLRRNVVATVLLVLLTGVGAGVVMASVAGIRRADQGWAEFQARNPDGDAVAAVLEADFEFPLLADEDFADEAAVVRSFPGVTRVTRGAAPILQVAARGEELSSVVGLLELDPPSPGTSSQPIIVAGRLADPRASDEAVLDEEQAKKLGVEVGDELDVVPFTAAQFGDLEQSASIPAAGEGSVVHVVGIIRDPNDILGRRAGASVYTEDGQVRLTAGWWDVVSHDVAAYGVAMAVDLDDDAAGRDRLAAQMEEAFGETAIVAPGLEFDIGIQPEVRAAVGSRLTAEGRALGAFAAVAALVALAIVGQALLRQLRSEAVDQPTLQGLGMRRLDLLAAAVLRSAALSAGAAVVAVAIALGASPWLPIGVGARVVEVGVLHLDVAVLSVGASLTALTVLAIAAGAALWAPTSAAPRSVRRTWAERAAGGGLPVTATLGLRMAFDRSVASRLGRAAVLAGGLALATLVSAAGLRASYDDFSTDPEQLGQVWDASAGNFATPEGFADGVRALSGIDGVAALGGEVSSNVSVDGRTVTAMAYTRELGELRPLVYEGRAPVDEGEVLLGRSLARALGVEIGDAVNLQFSIDEVPLPPVEVVGIGVAGSALIDAAPGTSVLIDADLIQRDIDSGVPQVLLVRFEGDADPDRVLAAIREVFADSTLPAPILPRAVQTIGRLSGLPLVLAMLVAVLATGVVVNALLGSIRLGRHQIGVLKALGCTRRQVGGVVAWQVTGWGVGAVLVGLPLGVLMAALGWKAVERALGVEAPLTVPWLVGAVGALAVLAVLNVIAVVPARRAARIPAAEALRTE